jgi:hypothetical protein
MITHRRLFQYFDQVELDIQRLLLQVRGFSEIQQAIHNYRHAVVLCAKKQPVY